MTVTGPPYHSCCSENTTLLKTAKKEEKKTKQGTGTPDSVYLFLKVFYENVTALGEK